MSYHSVAGGDDCHLTPSSAPRSTPGRRHRRTRSRTPSTHSRKDTNFYYYGSFHTRNNEFRLVCNATHTTFVTKPAIPFGRESRRLSSNTEFSASIHSGSTSPSNTIQDTVDSPPKDELLELLVPEDALDPVMSLSMVSFVDGEGDRA